MRKVSGMLIVAGFVTVLVAGSAADAMDIYTFKKDRVDQELEGNQGYISGKPADMPEKKRSSKRTLIGVDIELPSGLIGGKAEEETEAEERPKKETKPAAKEKARGKEEWVK